MYLSVHISTIYNGQNMKATQVFERVTGRKTRGLQTGNRLQVSDIFSLSLKWQEETNCQVSDFFFFLLHTKLKGVFSMEMFFLSYVNETMSLEFVFLQNGST